MTRDDKCKTGRYNKGTQLGPFPDRTPKSENQRTSNLISSYDHGHRAWKHSMIDTGIAALMTGIVKGFLTILILSR